MKTYLKLFSRYKAQSGRWMCDVIYAKFSLNEKRELIFASNGKWYQLRS